MGRGNFAVDITGNRFDYLTVVCRDGYIGKRKAAWLCECDCGRFVRVSGNDLRRGSSKSCGCKKNELISRAITKHGGKGTTLYHIWKGIRYRCNSENSQAYHNYGGRGIKMCDEWNDFSVFREWSMTHGYADGLTIERIFVDGPYSPDNCKWIPLLDQAKNRQNTIWVFYNGEKMCLSDVAKKVGMNYHTLYTRVITLGWDAEKAIHTPTARRHKGGD